MTVIRETMYYRLSLILVYKSKSLLIERELVAQNFIPENLKFEKSIFLTAWTFRNLLYIRSLSITIATSL